MRRENSKVSPPGRRRLDCEQLEPRLALSGSPIGLLNPEALTLSFVPDGTKVQNQTSALQATLSDEFGLSNWQDTIARAFQTWASYANLNIGVVPDGGQPLGIEGLTHADPRFGDIRVAGIRLTPDTTGEAIGQRQTIAGTWAGDVVLNTEALWPDEAKLFQVALHEAGHTLGLGHSENPASPMYAHTGSPTNGPTTEDIARLQSIYGPRRSDRFEGSSNNDTLDRASHIPNAELTDDFYGATPVVVYGDIQDAADKDVFLLPVLPGYQGPLSFRLWTSGISMLAGKLSVLDQKGNVLATATSASNVGGVLTVQISAGSAERYYARVEALASDVFAAGGYALVVTYDELNTVNDAEIQRLVLQGHQWQASTDDSAFEDVRRLLGSSDSESEPELDDDEHQDDSLNKPRVLAPVFDTAAVRRYQMVGTISDGTDADTYQLRSLPTDSSSRGLTISVENMLAMKLIPRITVTDQDGVSMPTSFIANGNGQVIARASEIQPDRNYFVQVTGANSTTGNYAFAASFDDIQISRTLLTSGALSAAQPQWLANLYVARPQLFSFALVSQAAGGSFAGQIIWATVYDEKHRTVAFVGSAVGDFRSGQSVMLSPGTYTIRFEGRDATGQLAGNATFHFYADAISDPIGPPIVDPGTDQIFICAPDGSNSAYCYPGEPPTTDPFATGPTEQPPPDPIVPVDLPPDIWFTPPDFLPTNPINPVDVTGDGFVSAEDALMVINYLNSSGSGADPLAPTSFGYLDVNNDGLVSAFDALMVINEINSSSSGMLAGAAGEPPPPAPFGTANMSEPLLMLLALDTPTQFPGTRRMRMA